MPKGYLKDQEERTCSNCGQKFIAHSYQMKYCSIKCQREFHENKPERQKYKIEYMRKYNKKRRWIIKRWQLRHDYGENAILAIKRDNFTCQKCGEKTLTKLEIHHMDWNRTNNSLENLLTLCGSCNKRLHHAITRQIIKLTPKEQIINLSRKWLA